MTTQPSHAHHPAGGHAHHDDHDHDHDMAELLDLDAEVLHAQRAELTAWLASVVDDPPHRILDLGCGTGAGTFDLLARFGNAEALAVDQSAAMLQRLTARAANLGLLDRVQAVQADLDSDWPDVGVVDLVWAAASLHHLSDPDRGLYKVRDTLAPGGVLVVSEVDGLPKVLPDDPGLGRPGLEQRCHTALAADRAARVPHAGDDWGRRMVDSGFELVADRVFDIDVSGPLPPAAGRYAQVVLQRIRGAVAGRLDADDFAALDALVDGPESVGVLHRNDLRIRSRRPVWVGRRRG